MATFILFYSEYLISCVCMSTMYVCKGFPGGSIVKNPPANTGDVSSIPGLEDPLEKETATHSTTLAWEIPWTEKAGGLYSIGVRNSRHDLATKQQYMYICVCI